MHYLVVCMYRRRYSVTGENTCCKKMQPAAKTFSLVVAATRNRGIGANSVIPWYLPKDLQHFKYDLFTLY
jgi:hypothetical protein